MDSLITLDKVYFIHGNYLIDYNTLVHKFQALCKCQFLISFYIGEES